MRSMSYSELRQGLAAAMDQVNEDHAPLYITRRRGKGAVLVSAEDFSSIEETMYLMSNPHNAARLTEAIEGLRGGDFEEQNLHE